MSFGSLLADYLKIHYRSLTGYLVFNCFAGTYGRCCISVIFGALNEKDRLLKLQSKGTLATLTERPEIPLLPGPRASGFRLRGALALYLTPAGFGTVFIRYIVASSRTLGSIKITSMIYLRPAHPEETLIRRSRADNKS